MYCLYWSSIGPVWIAHTEWYGTVLQIMITLQACEMVDNYSVYFTKPDMLTMMLNVIL